VTGNLGFLGAKLKDLQAFTHGSTELLEVCDWDEKAAEALLSEAVRIFEELHDTASREELETPIVLSALRERLRSIAYGDQIDTIMRLLRVQASISAAEPIADDAGEA